VRAAPPDELPIVREACVAPSDDEALALARPHLEGKYRSYVAWGQSEVMPGEDTLRRGWDELRAGRFVIGAPATVAAGLREIRERLGATLAVLRVQWPGLPHAQALRSLRLLGEQVLPRLGPAPPPAGEAPG
jgi:alkanesulfonate monooxygenase SsuD/methylene tetrahydromethanopterin reductase-like flavin-dependent oxidoreductase (luciferase family)